MVVPGWGPSPEIPASQSKRLSRPPGGRFAPPEPCRLRSTADQDPQGETAMLTLLLRSLCSGSPRKPQAPAGPGRRRSFVPRLEALEGRAVPSTLTVTNLGDTGAAGDGSLRGE